MEEPQQKKEVVEPKHVGIDGKKPDQFVGLKITIDGEKPVFQSQTGDQYVVEPEKKVFAGLPPGFKEKHRAGMETLYLAIQNVKKNLPKRMIPILRSELLSHGVPKAVLKDLERMGLMRTKTVDINNGRGKSLGGRCLVYFTPQGNAYIFERISNETASESKLPS